ncbi:MAG: (2Fe-2S) ferredoxin domain-containing protein, partial [Lachnospiraceae bacterium]|nr:(2Fe-2S) ferredoxin domain-containing protein [Lachnospiraceae bacterium]
MNRLSSREDLLQVRKLSEARIANIKCRILICAGTGCLAGGSQKIYEKMCKLCGNDPDAEIVFGEEVAHSGIDVEKSGCHGFCEMGPLVRIEPYNFLYIKVKPEDCQE